jgi:O-antigen/teichoic acid export membrane protein/capsular polysaccharide biosynthesis protein
MSRPRPVAEHRTPILRRVAARFSWGLMDQGMSSLSNAAVSFYIARELGAVKFGAFSLAYVTYSFALNGSRGLATDPLLVRFSGTDAATWRRAVANCTGTAVISGLVAGALALAAAEALSGTARLAFLALGITLPGLMLQDSWRYSFFAAGRGSQAFLNDTIWTVSLLPALVILRITHHNTVFWFILAWGLCAAVGALSGPFQARVIPSPTGAVHWLSNNRDLGPRYLAENTSNAGASQLRTYGIGIIAGLAAVGYVQAAGLLMGPFLVVFMGISAVTVPEASRIVRRSPRFLLFYCLLVGGGLAVLALAWGGALLVALPRGLGNLLLGKLWRPTDPLVLPVTIGVMGACLTTGATAGLHALGAARRSLRAMIIASAFYLSLGLLGALQGGALGTARGVALATWIGSLLWWRQLRVAMREHRIPVSLAIRPPRVVRPAIALQPAYAAALSGRSAPASTVTVAANGNGIDRQSGGALAGVDASAAQGPDPVRADPTGAGTADQPARAAMSGADDGRPVPHDAGEETLIFESLPAYTGSVDQPARADTNGADDGRPVAPNVGEETVIFDSRSAYHRYKSAFLPLDVHDDLAPYQWEPDDFAVVDEREHPPGALGAAGPRLTYLPYIVTAVRRLAWVWCAAALIGALAGAAYFKAVPPAHYEASTSILVTPNPADNPTSGMATEVALAQSRPVAELALSKLGLSQSQIQSSLNAFLKACTVMSTTDSVLVVTVKGPSSVVAVNAANDMAAAYLQYRRQLLLAQEQAVLAGLEQKISQAGQSIQAIGTQISQISALPATPVREAQLSNLRIQRSQQQAALTQLEQTTSSNQATTEAATELMLHGTGVLDPATPTTHSRLKQALIYVAGGLLAGLVIGLLIVAIQALVSDRLRWRDDITAALAAPVRLSVGTVRVRRWLPRKRRLAVARDSDMRRIVSYLRTVVYGRGISGLALVSVGNEDVAAVTLVSLAVSCAHENKRVVLADLSDGARAARLIGAGGTGIQTAVVDGESLVVAVPDPYTVVPVGPLDPPTRTLPAVSTELRAAHASADLMFTLVTLDPSMGAEYLPTWASDAVVLVTCGRSSATRIHAVGELIRQSGMQLVSAVLVGADKSDETLGITDSPSQFALANRRGRASIRS